MSKIQKFVFPFEALFAMGLIGCVTVATMYGVQGYQKFENWGKYKRYNVDRWDRRMMERDSRLTGNVNFQMAADVAPEQFSRNSAWELERPLI
jgi:NADH-ubiquinone oxidoreductase MWFE subunit